MTTPIAKQTLTAKSTMATMPMPTASNTSFTRARSAATETIPTTAASAATVPPMTGERTLNDAQLRAMGAEILHLFGERVLGNEKRQFNFSSRSDEYSIRGKSVEDIVLHTPDGSIGFRSDGAPMRNLADPVNTWVQAERGIFLALANLRSLDIP